MEKFSHKENLANDLALDLANLGLFILERQLPRGDLVGCMI